MKNLKILYIDDEEFIRKSAVMYLKFYYENVYEACNGIDGFKKYEEIKPDIIITDIKMPKLNGLDMVKKIREKDLKTKIIIATAFLETSYLLEAVELGLVKYLIKPITEDKLLPILDSCFESLVDDKSIFKLGGDFTFDILNETLFYENKKVSLTKTELELLVLLIQNQKRAVKYDEINNRVWNGEMSDDALRSSIRDLRRKTSKESIKNVSGIGYQINIIE